MQTAESVNLRIYRPNVTRSNAFDLKGNKVKGAEKCREQKSVAP